MPEWEEAWLEHVANYQGGPKLSSSSSPLKYASALYWNREFWQTAVRSVEQQNVDPYPSNLQIRCHRTLLLRPASMDAVYVPVWQDKDYGLPCRVWDRFWEDGYAKLYTSQLEWRPEEDDDDADDYEDAVKELELNGIAQRLVSWVERTDAPRSAIRFFDMPYTTEFHTNAAFRQTQNWNSRRYFPTYIDYSFMSSVLHYCFSISGPDSYTGCFLGDVAKQMPARHRRCQ